MKKSDFIKKIALVGTGFVGMSFAYALLNSGECDQLVLIDINKEKAYGEAMDLNHGLPFAKRNMLIFAGEYSDCADADIVVIAAGVNQKPGEDRISLLNRNYSVFKSIIDPIVESGFEGIFLVATNPVDIMTKITLELSKFDSSRVIGSGTTLDTARLRYLLGNYFSIDPRNVHAYVIGEHGDSEIVPWSQAYITTKSIFDVIDNSNGKFKFEDLNVIGKNVTGAAQEIIKAKSATYYGIGMALVRIVRTIFGDEKSALTASVMLDGHYGISGVYAGLPAIIGRNGVEDIIVLDLKENERKRFIDSCHFLEKTAKEIGF
ncbi:MAG: L-lactate dehydrogenase [Oscillospiraceae bacterium]|nr:L-lactate dehydrogenase [Oscillospiraceae bacterium]